MVMLLKINQNGQEFLASGQLLICAGQVFELGGGYRWWVVVMNDDGEGGWS